MGLRRTPWGPRPVDWPLVPWRSFATRAGTPIVVDPSADHKQVTVRVRHQGVIERRLNPHRRRLIETPNQIRASAGQFVISKIDARNGACGFVPPELEGAILTNDFPLYDISDAVDRRYLDHIVALPVFWRLCRSVSDGSTNRVRLDPALFDQLEFPMPPLSEQRAIAEVLDAIDDVIERTETVIAATERLREALLHELLARGVHGWHSEWTQAPGLGTVPACWEVVRLGAVASVQTGRAVNKRAPRDGDSELPYLSVANVKDGYLELSVVKTMLVSPEEQQRYGLRNGDVLFTEGGDADKLGRGTVWRGEIDVCLHQNHVFAVRPHDGVLAPDFLAAFAASAAGKQYFLAAAKRTTNLASLNSTQLKHMPLPLPSLEEQVRIIETLQTASTARSATIDSREALLAAKTVSADALLTGRVRVLAGTGAGR